MANKLSQTATARAERLASSLAKGILVSPEDVELLERYNWRVDKAGYARTEINGKTIHLHRLVHSRMTGKPLEEYTPQDFVRHIDPNGIDCRRSNLFEKTGKTANQCDLNVALQSNNTSGVIGVSWHKHAKQWLVRLTYLDSSINLGYYDTLEQAARVACHCRIIRSEITCSGVTMDYETMKALLQAESKKV